VPKKVATPVEVFTATALLEMVALGVTLKEMVAVVPVTMFPAESRSAIWGWVVNAMRLAAPAAARSRVSWETFPKLRETEVAALNVAGAETSAVSVLLPIRPSSAMLEKVAIPPEAEMAAVPESVDPLADKRTVCVD
jgi:hypothetical protein